MIRVYNINWKVAPKEWRKFRKWHAKACPSDPLTSEERFEKEGGVIPKKRKASDDDSGTKEEEQ